MKKRLGVVNTIATELGIDGNPMVHEDFFINNDDELESKKKEWMLKAHRVKFAKPFYRALLKDAHRVWLFERSGGRDGNSNWVGKKGWMAQVLQQTKDWVVDSEGAGAGAGGAGASKEEEQLRF